MLKIAILDMSMKITHLISQPHLPGANELRVNPSQQLVLAMCIVSSLLAPLSLSSSLITSSMQTFPPQAAVNLYQTSMV